MPDKRSARERMLAGDPYIADDPELTEMHHRASDLMEKVNATPDRDGDQRRRLLTEMLGSYGEDSVIRSPLYVDYGIHLHVGARSFVNFNLMALDVREIHIGNDVQIGPNVQLLTATHPLEPGLRRDKWEGGKPIIIENNVWLGGGVIVCPGVTIGENTVVGAGAVVTRDLPAGVVAVGNPAKPVRQLDPES